MPLGWERINERRTQPNKNIVFIKPFPGSTESIAKDFLERIAAQCLPITNKHHLAVVSLEEHEPNLEFWGRNFNNGEVIQLVLRSPSTGQWLPFKFVQMVMMHELAHCKQMNHGPAFWKLRNEFATDMKKLWGNGYTGEGLWGRGVLLDNGAFAHEELGEGEILPEHMCGGTFRSRGGRKRSAPKPKITYKERQERRIKKKFGANGMTLGADDGVKVELEKGKKPVGRPRAAGSNRGRELRAAAALKRFDVVKDGAESVKDEDLVTDSDTEDENDNSRLKAEPDDALDINGKRLLDTHGRGMVKVCDDEDRDDSNAQNELRELEGIQGQSLKFSTSNGSSRNQPESSKSPPKPSNSFRASATPAVVKTRKPSPPPPPPPTSNPAPQRSSNAYLYSIPEWKPPAESRPPSSNSSPRSTPKPQAPPVRSIPPPAPALRPVQSPSEVSCPICTTTNEPTALTCDMCSHVLHCNFVPGSWHCNSEACEANEYVNAGDVALCGVCGTRRGTGVCGKCGARECFSAVDL